MSGNLGYTKKFIILKKDFSNMTGLSSKGHGKLEVKGLKGSVAISLENAPDNDYYNVLLISKNTSYDLGKIYTDDNGRGREDLVFNIQDLESKGFSIDKINGVLIKKDSNILVGGYVEKNDGSLEKFIKQLPVHDEVTKFSVESKAKPETPAIEIIEEQIVEKPVIEELIVEEKVVEEKIVEEKIVEEKIVEEKVVEEPIIEEPVLDVEREVISPETLLVDDEFKYESTNEIIINQILESDVGVDFVPIFEPILELNQEPEAVAEIIEEATEILPKEPWPVSEATEEIIQTDDLPNYNQAAFEIKEESKTHELNFEKEVEVLEYDTEQSRRINQRNQTTSYVLNILRFFPYTEPFRMRLEGYNWWKIDFQEEARGFLPYFSYLVGGDQKTRRSDNFVTSRDLMGIYNHYLFGLYTVGEEVKYYVYAVPGGFYKDEHPHGGSTGFNTWFAGQDIDGYWLLYIDPLTGKVIYPINPMNPTE